MRRSVWIAGVASAGLAWGCQELGAGLPARMAATARPVLAGSPEAALPRGVVGARVRLGAQASRSAQATLAAVDAVAFSLQQASQADRDIVLFRDQFGADGAARAEFSEVPAGPVTLTARVLDGAGAELGTGSAAGTVEPGMTLQLSLVVTLEADTAPSGEDPAESGGDTGSNTGSVDSDVTIVEGGAASASTGAGSGS